MAKNEKQKLKLLYLKQILEEYTDENHGLTMERLLGLLAQKGIKAERKSIYDDIFVLAEDFNMGIELDKSKRPPEYKLLDSSASILQEEISLPSILCLLHRPKFDHDMKHYSTFPAEGTHCLQPKPPSFILELTPGNALALRRV